MNITPTDQVCPKCRLGVVQKRMRVDMSEFKPYYSLACNTCDLETRWYDYEEELCGKGGVVIMNTDGVLEIGGDRLE